MQSEHAILAKILRVVRSALRRLPYLYHQFSHVIAPVSCRTVGSSFEELEVQNSLDCIAVHSFIENIAAYVD
jgi:hypothetical protein